jgi:hypothetical protein
MGKREKQVFSGVGTSGMGMGTMKGEWECIWWIYFVSIYEDRRMQPVEIILRKGKREIDGGGKSN